MSILEKGMLPSTEGVKGPGIYFTDDKKVAWKVAKGHAGKDCPLVLTFEVDVSEDVVIGPHPAGWLGMPSFTEYCVKDATRILRQVGVEGHLDLKTPANYISNVGNPCFLDTDGARVQTWGDAVTTGDTPENLQWLLVPVVGEPDTFYIVHKRFNKFLDSHGETCQLWGNGRDTGDAPDNIKWKREAVRRAPNTYYLIHKASNKFLDTHGAPKGGVGFAQLWHEKGDAPRNLQWRFQAV